MSIKLPTNPMKPAYLRKQENKVSEERLIEEAKIKRLRSSIVEISRRVDRMQIMEDEDLPIAVNRLAEYLDDVLGQTILMEDQPGEDKVIRPPELQHFCSFCNDPLSDWSQTMHMECRLAKEKLLARKETKQYD